MKNSMVTFFFSVFERKYSFYEQICFEKSRLFIEAEIWNLE